MNFSTALENRNFSSRTIVKRTMLPAEISVESCLLLAELLTRFLSRQKKRISAYAGGRIAYSVSFDNAPIFLSTLVQTQTGSLKYAFVNPYQKGLEMLLSYPESVLNTEEKTFAFAKEKVLFKAEQLATFSLEDEFLKRFSSREAFPQINEEKLKAMRLEEVQKALDALRKSVISDVIFLGPQQKENPLVSFAETTSLPKVKVEIPEEDILSKNLSKEGVALVFSFQEEVKNESDFFLSLQALATIRANLIEKLHKVFGSPVRSNAYLLSPKNGVIILSVDVLKGALLASKLPLEEGFILNSLDEKSYQEGLLDIHDQNLSRLSDQRETVRQMLQFRDFEIEPGEFFFTGKDFSKVELKEALKKIDFVKALNAKLI